MKIARFPLFGFSFFVIASAEALNILGVFPFSSNSHFAIGSSIIKALHKAGHNVTVVSPYPRKVKVDNYHDVDASEVLAGFKEKIPNPFLLEKLSAITTMLVINSMGENTVKALMENEETKKFLKTESKFDICIFEIFNADALLGIADHYGCIVISYSTFSVVKWVDDITSNQSPYSYVPHGLLSYSDRMSFSERLSNTYHSLVENLIFQFYYLPKQRDLYKNYFPQAKQSFDVMYKSPAIIFMNSHVSSASPRPFLPNMIEIGGIHVEPAKPLPKDFQDFLDSAEHGAILFSMGSIIQAVKWPEEKREAFVRAFKKLKLKVLWKYENETLPNKPENVMISPWIPQRDILAHPNVKLFITHGGLLGTTEALVEGVPVLGIPIFGDQRMNMLKAVESGYGLQINFNEISEENFDQMLKKILNEEKFKEKAKLISERFMDRPMSPKDSVVYWTEFAFRHGGAKHLKSAGNDLSFVEFYLIDVYAAMLGMAVLGFVLSFYVLRLLGRKFR